MTRTEKLLQQAEALSKTAVDLETHCNAFIAAIEAAEAKQREEHKRHLAAIDAIFDAIDKAFAPPKQEISQ